MRALPELLAALLVVGLVLVAIATVFVLLLKGAVRQFTRVLEDSPESPDDTGTIPRQMLRFTTATLCHEAPAVHEVRSLGADEDFPKFFIEEDDWRQVEFVPTSLRDAILEEVAVVSKFKVDKWEGSGWIDVYIRREYPGGLPSLELPFRELNKLFEPRRRHGLSVVSLNSNDVAIAKVDGSFVFEASERTFFYGQEHDGSVAVLALKFFGQGFGDYSKLIEKLAELGEAFPLLMVDWNNDVIVDLRQREEIERWVDPIDDVA